MGDEVNESVNVGMTQRELLLEHDRRLTDMEKEIRDFRAEVHEQFAALRLDSADARLREEQRFSKIETRLAQGVTLLAVVLFLANIVGPLVATGILQR